MLSKCARIALYFGCFRLLACHNESGKAWRANSSVLEVSADARAAAESPKQVQRHLEQPQFVRAAPHVMRSEPTMLIRSTNASGDTDVAAAQSPVEKRAQNSHQVEMHSEGGFSRAQSTFRQHGKEAAHEDSLLVKDIARVAVNATAMLGNWDEWRTGQCTAPAAMGRPLFRTRQNLGAPGSLEGCQVLCTWHENVTCCEFADTSGSCYGFSEECPNVMGDRGMCARKLLSDCEWTEWEAGECSGSCGTGTCTRTREIHLPAAMGGSPCTGPEEDEALCQLDPCPPGLVPAEEGAFEGGARHSAQPCGYGFASIAALSFLANVAITLAGHSY